MNFSLKKLLVFTAVIAFVVWFIHGAYVELTHVETGENVASVDWLPETASNVSYYKSYSFTSYEFDIPESEFVNWSHWDLQPISEPFSVMRYCYFSVDIPEPGPNATDADLRAFSDAYSSRSANITDGLYYEHVQHNGGGVWVAYDRKRGRAFYHSAPR